MCNKIVGEIKCPLCGSDDATVHVHAKGKAKYYVRCYEGKGGNTLLCGTLQAVGPTGQAFIVSNANFYDGEGPQKETVLPKSEAIASPPSVATQQDAIESPTQVADDIPPPSKKKTLYELLVG